MEFKRDTERKKFAVYAKRTALIVLIILAIFPSTLHAATATSNECEDYARGLGIDEQVVSILSWLCLDGVMDEGEKEFIELLAKLAPELQWDLANRLAIDGQISESDLAEVRAIFNAPINSFETQEEMETWGTEDGAVLEQAGLYATEGRYSGKVSFTSGEDIFPGISLNSETLKVTDWSSYYAVGLDIYNPQDQEESFFLEYHIADEDGSNFWPDFMLAPGMNHLRIYIDDLRNDRPWAWEVDEELIREESGAFDTHHIKELKFYIEPPVPRIYEGPQPNGPILYFDNLRLIPQEEAPETDNLLKNGGFENSGSGWYFPRPRDPNIIYAFDRGHSGNYSLKITCSEYSEGWIVVAQYNTVTFEEGKWYEISLWAKEEGMVGASLEVFSTRLEPWGSIFSQHFALGNTWRKYTFAFQAQETNIRNNRVGIAFTETGTVRIDDVRLIEIEKPLYPSTMILPSEGVTNLIPNSSFEVGADGWGTHSEGIDHLFGEIDCTDAAVGDCSMKIRLSPETFPILHWSEPAKHFPTKFLPLANKGWFQLEPGGQYTLSAYLKSDQSNTVVTASIIQLAGFAKGRSSEGQYLIDSIDHEFVVDTFWKRYSFNTTPEEGDLAFIRLGADLDRSGLESATLWVDGVQFEKGRATPYRPRHPIEFGIDTGKPSNVYRQGESLNFDVLLFNSMAQPWEVTLCGWIVDFFNRSLWKKEWHYELLPQQTFHVPVATGIEETGFYRAYFTLEYGNTKIEKNARMALIYPYTVVYPDADSIFGINGYYPLDHAFNLAHEGGITWVRDWSLFWDYVEPKKGEFDFVDADVQIDHLLDLGLHVLALLCFPSNDWSTTAPPEVSGWDAWEYMPEDIADFGNYVYQTVSHYKDRIKHWEILNEPSLAPEEYLEILKTAYRAAKRAAPDCVIIGGWSMSFHYWPEAEEKYEQLFQLGGLDYMDAINVHPYPGVTTPEWFDAAWKRFNALMDKYGRRLPIWITEYAYQADDDRNPTAIPSPWSFGTLESEQVAAEWTVKYNVIALAHNVEKVFQHAHPSEINLNCDYRYKFFNMFFEDDVRPRKTFVAHNVMATMLAPGTKFVQQLDLDPGIWAYLFEREGKPLLVVWSDEEQELSLPFSSGQIEVLNIMGNPVQSQPLRLTSSPLYVKGDMSVEEFIATLSGR